MANDILGSELNISGLEEGIARIEKKMTALSADMTRNSNNIIKAFQEINASGVQPLISKLEELQRAMNKVSAPQQGQKSNPFAKNVDDINKMIATLDKSSTTWNNLQRNIYANEQQIKRLTESTQKFEAVRARIMAGGSGVVSNKEKVEYAENLKALDILKQQVTSWRQKQQAIIQNNQAIQSQLKLQEDLRRAEQDRTSLPNQRKVQELAQMNEYYRQQEVLLRKNYEAQANLNQQKNQQKNTTFDGAIKFSDNATSINRQQKAIEYLTQARAKLNLQTKEGQKQAQILSDKIRQHTENINRAKQSTDEYQKSLRKLASQRLERIYSQSPNLAMNFSQNAKSINDQILAIKRLKSARDNLNRGNFASEEAYRKKIQESNNEIKRLQKEVDKLRGKQERLGKSHHSLMNTTDQLQRKLALVFSVSAIQGYVNKLISIRGEFEMQNRSLQILLQNKDEANKLWDKTVQLAVKSPFSVRQLVTYTKQLAAYRVKAEELYDTTKMLADVSAGLGVDMNRLILAFGQVKAANFLRGTELRQFSEAGVNMLEELAARFTKLEGKAVSVGDVFERISKRLVSFKDVEAVFKTITSEGGIFYQMQEKQADTTKGMIMNLKDQIDLMLNSIGAANDGLIKGSIVLIREFLANWRLMVDQIYILVGAYSAVKIATLAYSAANKVAWDSTGLLATQIYKNKMRLKDWRYEMTFTSKTSSKFWTSLKIAGVKAFMGLQGAIRVAGLALKSFLPFAIISGIIELWYALNTASQKAEEFADAVEMINSEIAKDTQNSIDKYILLAETVRDLTKSEKEREDALKKMHSAFQDILPDEMLQANYIKVLAGDYSEATKAMRDYYNNLRLEQQKSKVREIYGKDVETNTADLKHDMADIFMDSKFADTMGNNNADAIRAGYAQAIEQVRMDMENGKISADVDTFKKEFIRRITDFAGLDEEAQKKLTDLFSTVNVMRKNATTWESLNIGAELAGVQKNIKELTGDINELNVALGGLNASFGDTFEEQQMREQAQKTKDEVAIIKKAFTDLSNLTKQRATGEVTTWGEILPDINKIYAEVQQKAPKYKDAFNQVWKQLRVAAEQGSLNFNTVLMDIADKFYESVANIATTTNKGNTVVKNYGENLSKSLDSKKLTKQGKAVTQVYQDIAKAMKIDPNIFSDFILTSEKSLSDIVKMLDGKAKELQDEAKKIRTSMDTDIATSLLYSVFGIEGQTAKEYLANLDEMAQAFAKAAKQLGHYDKKSGKGDNIWSRRLSILKDLHKEYETLNKTFDKTTSKQKVSEGYTDAVNELFKGLGITIDDIDFTSLEQLVRFIDDRLVPFLNGKNLQEALKLKAQFQVDIDTTNTQAKQANIFNELESLFDEYELGKELEKLHLPKGLMKQLFDVDVLSLDELRDKITSINTSEFGDDAKKEYEKLLAKIRKMELKEQEDRMKMYSKYLIKAQNERVKIKMEELNHINDIEKTFAFDVEGLANRFNINPEVVTKFQNRLDSLSTTWGDALEHINAYRDEMLRVGFTEQQISQMCEYAKMLKSNAASAKQAVQKETQDKLDKQAWKEFTGSEYYVEIFADLDKISTSVIKTMMSRLESLKNSLGNLEPTEIKQVVEAIEKMQNELTSREGNSYKEIIADTKEYIKYLRKRKSLEEKYNESQRTISGLESQRDAQIKAIALYQQQYDVAVDTHGVESAEALLFQAILNASKELLETTLSRLVTEGKISAELAQQIKNGETLKESLKDRLKNNATDLNAGFQAFSGMMESIQSVTGSFGEDTQDFIENVGKVVNGIATVETGLSEILDGKVITGTMNMVSGVFQTIGGILGFGNNDKKKERQIQKELDLVEKSEKAYEKLEKAIDDAYRVDTLKQSYDLANDNINKQITSYEKMIQLEKDKKDTDNDRIKEWRDNIEELREMQKELLQEQVEELGGSYDIRSTTREFVDAWVEAFNETGNGLQGLQDNFKEFFKNIVLEQAVMRGAGTLMQPLLDMINESLEDDFVIDTSELSEIEKESDKAMSNLDKYLNSLFGKDGIYSKWIAETEDSEMSGLQKGIQGITEETAQILEAYLNSMRFYVADSNMKLTQLINMQTNEELPNPMLAQLKIIATQTSAIFELLNGITAPHPTLSGRGLKVVI